MVYMALFHKYHIMRVAVPFHVVRARYEKGNIEYETTFIDMYMTKIKESEEGKIKKYFQMPK